MQEEKPTVSPPTASFGVPPMHRPLPPTALVAAATPVFWDLDPAQLVEVVVGAVERVLSQLSASVRDVVRDEIEAWRCWAAGRLSTRDLRESARSVLAALERGGRHDLPAVCVAVAAQTVETAARIEGVESDVRRRTLLWSARMSAERAVRATELARSGR